MEDFETSVVEAKKAYGDEITQEVAEQRALNQRQIEALRKSQAERKPEWEALKKKQAEVEAITPPKLERPPEPPRTQEMLQPSSLQKTMGMASIFALMSVGIAKDSAIYGLKALGGFMEGAHQGNVEQAEAALKDYNAQMARVRLANDTAMQEYNAIFNNKKLTLEQQQQMFHLKALEFNDELSIQQLEQGGMNAVHTRLRDLAKTNFAFDKELVHYKQVERQIEHQRVMEGIAQQKAAGSTGGASVLGIPMADIPQAQPGQKNDAFLKMLAPAQAEMVKRMADGSLPAAGFGGLAVKDRNELIKAAAIYDPAFDANRSILNRTIDIEYSPKGGTGQNILAINTMTYHIDRFAENFSKLNNSQAALWNSTKNKLGANFGDPRIKQVQADAIAVKDEMSRILKGGRASPTDMDKEIWSHIYTTDLSPSQAKAIAWESMEIAGGRLDQIEQAYMKERGRPYGALYPETIARIEKYKPKNEPTPTWLRRSQQQSSSDSKPNAGGRLTVEQAKDLIRKYGSVEAAKKAAQEQGLQF